MDNKIKYLIEQLIDTSLEPKFVYVSWPDSQDFILENDAYVVENSDESADMMVPLEMYEEKFGPVGPEETLYIMVDFPECQDFLETEYISLDETPSIMVPEEIYNSRQ